MRTIPLTEHEGRLERLTAEELQQLLMLPAGLLKVTAHSRGTYQIKSYSRVGTLVLPTLRVLIRPKAGVRNVLWLLAHAHRISWSAQAFPYDRDEDLLDAMAWWFDRECTHAERFGLSRDYVDRAGALYGLRGKLALERQLATRPGQRAPQECEWRDYSEDIALNQVVKAAHHVLLRRPDLHHRTATRLRHRARLLLGGTSNKSYHASALPSPLFTRLNRHWEPAFCLARMILLSQSIRDERGEIVGAAFIVDMNKLFEQFVAALVARRLGRSRYALETQARRHLAKPAPAHAVGRRKPIPMQPDIVLRLDEVDVAVADTKYKLRRSHHDLHQLLAYIVSLGLDRGLLIYAGRQRSRGWELPGNAITLRTIGVDLEGDHHSILAQGFAAADALIASADAAASMVTAPKANAAPTGATSSTGATSNTGATPNASAGAAAATPRTAAAPAGARRAARRDRPRRTRSHAPAPAPAPAA